MIIQAIRSILFYLAFGLVTLVLATVASIGILIPPYAKKVARFCATVWTRAVKFLLWLVVGIRSRVTGRENIPSGPCIIASKHQSDLDTVVLYPEFNHPAFAAKVELAAIPLVGATMRALDIIFIDRKKRGGALASLIEQSRLAIQRGRHIFIFPEGTRRLPLAPRDYRFGVAKLYEALDVPVLPVALNSGLFWGRNSLILWPGTARATILPPIPPGLGAKEMHEMLTNVIEAESTRLALEAVEKGLSRPISAQFRQRIESAKKNLPKQNS
ncbi:MAG TPA: 1-acyl-sn-glycerol-3-phosphate acyltransferase [Devosia sp.]|nr:1-acyl-sn-glycerol-3-phosphate acyltransferase [Devosia sp.]